MQVNVYDLVSRIEQEQNNPELKKACVDIIISTVRSILIDQVDSKINLILDRTRFAYK